MLHRSFKYHIFAVLIMCIVCIAIYSNTLSTPFIFDDKESIEDNSAIRLNRLGFNELYNATLKGKASTRPLVGLTFALNYYFGQYEVRGYHIVNIIIHLINGVLVYFLALLMFRQLLPAPARQPGEAAGSAKGDKAEKKKQKDKSSKLKAESLKQKDYNWYDYSFPVFCCSLFAALIFIVHPIQTQAVTYIVQRYASMAAMFYLGAILFYLKARLRVKSEELRVKNVSEVIKISGLYALCVLCGIFALLSKQNTASLPMAILLAEYIFIDQTWQGWKKKIIWIIPVFVLFVAGILLFLGVFGGSGQGANLLEDVLEHTRETKLVGRWSYLCTQFNVLVIYIRLLFLPAGQNLDYLYPFKTGFFDGLTPLAFLFLLGLAAFGVWKRKKWPLITFAIFWFFITLSVESSLIPIKDAIFEHRLYLPMFGFSIAVSSVIFHLFSKRRQLGLILALAIIISLGTSTYLRNRIWKDKVSLWSDVVSKSPSNWRAHANLGIALHDHGNAQDAIRHLSKAIEIWPGYGKAHYNLGLAVEMTGDLNKAVNQYREAIRINAGDEKAHVNLGIILARQGKLNDAKRHFLKALKIKPSSAEACINLGLAYMKLGEFEKAKKTLRRALRISPESHEAHYNLGFVFFRQGNRDNAVRHFSEALRANPDLAAAHHHMAIVLAQQGKLEDAGRHFLEVVRIHPNSADAHMNLGIILSQQGKLKEAIMHFTDALRINPRLEKARQYLEVLYQRLAISKGSGGRP